MLIMVSLNRKHEQFRQYKNGIVTFDNYNSFKNNFTTTLRHARNNYFQRRFTECSNNSSDTWKILNSLIQYKNNSKDVILNHNGSTVSDLSAIAEVFNNYFSNTVPTLIAIFLTQIHFHWIAWEHLWKIHFSALPLIGVEIVNLIRRQKNKSTDLMNIPVFIYKILTPIIFHTVSMLINNSLSEGTFP